MASIKLVLRTQKINKVGEAPLYIRVTQNRKSHFISLGIYVNPKDWNEDQQKVKKSHPNSTRINNFLIQKLADTQGSILDTEVKSETISTRKVRKAITGQTEESFIKHFEKYAESLRSKKKVSSYIQGKSILKKIKSYVGENKDITFEQINVVWIKNYESHLQSVEQNKLKTIRNIFIFMRATFNDAIREDIITADKNPFLKYKIPNPISKREFLSEDEILMIESYESKSKNEQLAKDLYLFSFFGGGLRFGDCVTLKWQNIKEDKIYLQQKKTSSIVHTKLIDKAKNILEKYRTEQSTDNDYIFPILSTSDDELDEESYYTRSLAKHSSINNNLKKIASSLGITKNIHFHTSRHTFATIALKRGMRIEYVSKLMGHSNISTTQIYAKIINEELDKAMMETFG